jgi:hypothetical protein
MEPERTLFDQPELYPEAEFFDDPIEAGPGWVLLMAMPREEIKYVKEEEVNPEVGPPMFQKVLVVTKRTRAVVVKNHRFLMGHTKDHAVKALAAERERLRLKTKGQERDILELQDQIARSSNRWEKGKKDQAWAEEQRVIVLKERRVAWDEAQASKQALCTCQADLITANGSLGKVKAEIARLKAELEASRVKCAKAMEALGTAQVKTELEPKLEPKPEKKSKKTK